MPTKALPWPWNISQDRKKLVIKIASSEVTTAVVVDWPTPFAPPVVVRPQLEPITAIKMPKITALIRELAKSQVVKKLRAELINTLEGMS